MYKYNKHQLKKHTLAALLTAVSTCSFAADSGAVPKTGMAVRHDTSPPLSELIDMNNQMLDAGQIISHDTDFTIPNILNIDPGPAEQKFNIKNRDKQTRGGGTGGSNGLPTAPVMVSAQGYSTQDNLDLGLGNFIPPDTNGDVGPNFYIQYVNVGWAIFNKADGSLSAGPFVGNTFWAGFGGPCQTNNAGDPIVLYDKTVDRWVFSQFTSSANPDGRQCFAVSTTNDPMGPYHRYEFVFPGEFNDYPHIGIWDDEEGGRSGYYFVTHDFFDVGGPNQGFRQASFAVVERDQMLNGDPAQFVRFTDTNFLGSSSFGAQPAHLESIELAPAGQCNPFVMARPDQQGYQINNLCVNWDNAATSQLSEPIIVDAGESWTPGPGGVAQAGGAGNLDTLAQFGRIMYRATYRAYPDSSPLDDTMVISFPVDLGGGQAGVRWAQINFADADLIYQSGFEDNPTPPYTVANQGEYGPDADDRWMPGISIDKDGNIGLAYSASNATDGVFPGVRFTTRRNTDPANTLRDEQVCVDGGGTQTGGSRWGDYSSLSVDPVDECTFWASVEYQLTTAGRNWSNRICSFKVDGCGEPSVALTSDNLSMNVCAATTDAVTYGFDLFDLNGFNETVTMSVANEPSGSTASFPGGDTFSTFPASGTLEISGLMGMGSSESTLTLTAMSTNATSTLDYSLSISEQATVNAATLTAPADNTVDADLLQTYSWTMIPDALSYRLEVATDAGFTDVVFSTETTDLSVSVTQALAVNTTYFWRVTGLNNCGPGLASSTFQFTTGSFLTGTVAECTGGTTPNVVFFDDLEGDVSDWLLPAAPIGTNTWAQSSARAFSGSSFFAQDVPTSSDQYLVSPPITLPAASQAPISLSYWNFQSIEANNGVGPADACWDGGLLEISTDGGNTFTQIANSDMIGDQYNGATTVQALTTQPISGLDAWCATSAVPASGDQTDIGIVNLNAFAGQTVQFRFRLGTDGAAGDEGWYIDNVTVQGCQ